MSFTTASAADFSNLSGSLALGQIPNFLITGVKISSTAGITYGKLTVTGLLTAADVADFSLANTDISSTAGITYGKLTVTGLLTAADLSPAARSWEFLAENIFTATTVTSFGTSVINPANHDFFMVTIRTTVSAAQTLNFELNGDGTATNYFNNGHNGGTLFQNNSRGLHSGTGLNFSGFIIVDAQQLLSEANKRIIYNGALLAGNAASAFQNGMYQNSTSTLLDIAFRPNGGTFSGKVQLYGLRVR